MSRYHRPIPPRTLHNADIYHDARTKAQAAFEDRIARRREAKRLAAVFLCSFAELVGVLLMMAAVVMFAFSVAPDRCCQVGVDGYGVSVYGDNGGPGQ